MGVIEGRREQFKVMADAAYAGHLLQAEGQGRWLCRTPGKGFYWYRVIVAPGCVLMYGDIGPLVLRLNDPDALNWLIRVRKDLDYVLGKAENRKREFLTARVTEYLAELRADPDEYLQAQGRNIQVVLDVNGWLDSPLGRRPQDEWYWACQGYSFDDPPDCEDWGADMLWGYWALVKFCELFESTNVRDRGGYWLPKTEVPAAPAEKGTNDGDHGT